MKHRLLIIRRDRDETAVATVTLEAPSTFTKKEIFRAIKTAVTSWFATYPQAKAIHTRVRNTFNVGDLSEHLDDPDLKEELYHRGIIGLKIEVASEQYPFCWEYDNSLYDERELQKRDEAIARHVMNPNE